MDTYRFVNTETNELFEITASKISEARRTLMTERKITGSECISRFKFHSMSKHRTVNISDLYKDIESFSQGKHFSLQVEINPIDGIVYGVYVEGGEWYHGKTYEGAMRQLINGKNDLPEIPNIVL